VDELAAAWAREKCHGEDSSLATIHRYLLCDLNATEVEFWQCQQCALEFANPMRSWTASHYPMEGHSLGFDHLATLADLSTMPPTRILDIGCADGEFLERAGALGHDVTGIDFSPEDVEKARRRGLQAYLAGVDQIGKMFAGQRRFKMITLFQVIEHLNQPDRIFAQIAEVADDDAQVVIGCPSDLRYTRRFAHPQRVDRSDFWDYPPQHTLRWTPKALTAFLLRHGWQTGTVTYEPLILIGAAAHLTGIQQLARGETASRWTRRLQMLGWLVKLSGSQLFGRTTGIRLLVKGRRLTITPGDTPGS
jgi:2-polyprenyl-3-methyl-5-hydroxy-6-metoxy-1,4-benzoquinol methylase